MPRLPNGSFVYPYKKAAELINMTIPERIRGKVIDVLSELSDLYREYTFVQSRLTTAENENKKLRAENEFLLDLINQNRIGEGGSGDGEGSNATQNHRHELVQGP